MPTHLISHSLHQYATPRIDAQLLILREFTAGLQDIAQTVRQVVDVVSKYAGPDPVRGLILSNGLAKHLLRRQVNLVLRVWRHLELLGGRVVRGGLRAASLDPNSSTATLL